MPAAARLGDITNHGGSVTGPGDATVLIGGKPATVMADLHVCSLPPSGHQPTSSPFLLGSTTVLISGKAAIRAGDTCICGASVVVGDPTVQIG